MVFMVIPGMKVKYYNNLYNLIKNEIYNKLIFLGENPNNYIVRSYPLMIERIDKQPLPDNFLSYLYGRQYENLGNVH